MNAEASGSVPAPVLIAVDGGAACGKSTIARALAEAHAFAYLETGLLYRKTALLFERALEASGEPPPAGDGFDGGDGFEALAADAAARVSEVGENGEDEAELRGETIAARAAELSALPAVRAALLAVQRDFAAKPPGGLGGAVLEGRDIGTVILPHADCKLFITASAPARARRRYLELRERGESPIEESIRKALEARDARDRDRPNSPLRPATDAVFLDTTELSAEGAVGRALQLVRECLGSARATRVR